MHKTSECFTLSQHYPNFVSTLSQKFELSTQRTKLISYENGMVLCYSNNTINKSYLTHNCIYIWINTIIICISSVSSVAAPGVGTRKICKGLGKVHVSASNKNRQ